MLMRSRGTSLDQRRSAGRLLATPREGSPNELKHGVLAKDAIRAAGQPIWIEPLKEDDWPHRSLEFRFTRPGPTSVRTRHCQRGSNLGQHPYGSSQSETSSAVDFETERGPRVAGRSGRLLVIRVDGCLGALGGPP